MTIKKSVRKIVFKPQPFFTCLTSALEVYKRETYGLLFGQTDNGIIDFAYTFQTAERTFANIYCDGNIEDYLISQANRNFGLIFIGDFHSHTDYKGSNFIYRCISDLDISELKKQSPRFIKIILNLTKGPGRFLSVDMKAYYHDEQKRIRRAKLVLPRRLEEIISFKKK